MLLLLVGQDDWLLNFEFLHDESVPWVRHKPFKRQDLIARVLDLVPELAYLQALANFDLELTDEVNFVTANSYSKPKFLRDQVKADKVSGLEQTVAHTMTWQLNSFNVEVDCPQICNARKKLESFECFDYAVPQSL
eukprot:CAMPEP_0204903630 /NCGR_PEP_ID=MMETSP1397-20131031/4384_1 /ASSEMBLY_ACC=CAM_ASM_000891 /TAXON_ID=49980 /ORGANISM="Climacostomum Climacostomum virens, Strain Stock W-24" /LENGTH=135 /DNA_ID=CAMNT_0052072311 /DNA_START=635 /DNA_END=1042 /DNA_ORIENTATION=+